MKDSEYHLNSYMRVAKSICDTSEHHKVHIGACVVQGHSVVSVGVNTKKSHPMQARYNQYRDIPYDYMHNYLHAEMQAIIRANNIVKDLNNSTLYVYREDKKGNIAMCRPCNACMKKIKEVGIKKIVYTTYDGIAKETLF